MQNINQSLVKNQEAIRATGKRAMLEIKMTLLYPIFSKIYDEKIQIIAQPSQQDAEFKEAAAPRILV